MTVAVANGEDCEVGADEGGFLQELTPDRVCVRRAPLHACLQAMTFQTVSSLLSCPMCDEPKKKQMVAPSSDAFVNMYTKYSVSSASPTQLAAIAKANGPVYGHPASRWANAKQAYNPYPRTQTYN
jgi:hypothetical protein